MRKKRFFSLDLVLVVSVLYTVLCYLSLFGSHDLYSQIRVIDYYTNREGASLTTAQLVMQNNSTILLYRVFYFLDPIVVLVGSYVVIAWIWSVFVLSKYPSLLATILLFMTFVFVLNTHRQLLAYVIFLHYYKNIEKNKLFGFLYFSLASVVHNTSLLTFVLKKINMTLVFVFFAIIYFVLMYDFVPTTKYGHSSNPSKVQGHAIPSVVISLVVAWCFNKYNYFRKTIYFYLMFFATLHMLVETLNFNQFIYIGRVAWFITIALVILNQPNIVRLSSKNYFILCSSLIILGTYHNFVFARDILS